MLYCRSPDRRHIGVLGSTRVTPLDERTATRRLRPLEVDDTMSKFFSLQELTRMRIATILCASRYSRTLPTRALGETGGATDAGRVGVLGCDPGAWAPFRVDGGRSSFSSTQARPTVLANG